MFEFRLPMALDSGFPFHDTLDLSKTANDDLPSEVQTTDKSQLGSPSRDEFPFSLRQGKLGSSWVEFQALSPWMENMHHTVRTEITGKHSKYSSSHTSQLVTCLKNPF